MKELSKETFLETMKPPMRRFSLNKSLYVESISSLAKEILEKKRISAPEVSLEYCYENEDKSFAHFLMYWGRKENYLVIIADDRTSTWRGYYLLDLIGEYELAYE